jgi:hypothetical protein
MSVGIFEMVDQGIGSTINDSEFEVITYRLFPSVDREMWTQSPTL